MSSDRIPFEVEVNVHVLAKTTRVIVPVGFSVAKSLQNAVRLKQDILHPVTTKFMTKRITSEARFYFQLYNRGSRIKFVDMTGPTDHFRPFIARIA